MVKRQHSVDLKINSGHAGYFHAFNHLLILLSEKKIQENHLSGK